MTDLLFAATGSGIDLGGALTGAASEITAQVQAALPVALPIAGGLIAVGVGWRLFRKFIKA